MSRRALVPLMMALACACGEKEKTTPPTGGGQSASTQPEQKRPDAAAQQEAARKAQQEREARRTELQQKKDELAATVAAAKKTLEELDKRQAEELKGLPDLRKLRPYLMGLIRDSNTESARLQSMERQYAELKETVAKTKVSAELQAIQDELEAVEKRYWEAHSGWLASREEARFGAVQESPVKRDLDQLRAIRAQWFQATPMARRGAAGGSEKKIINDGFRAWLSELPDRQRVASETIGGKAVDGYDFSDLRFYLVLSKRELELEKQNITLEKKELDENAVKLAAIEKEMDALRERLAEKLAEGGGDLERYNDLAQRMKDQRTKAADLKRMVDEYEATFAEVEGMKERQLKEQDDAARALEAAEKELKETSAALAKLG